MRKLILAAATGGALMLGAAAAQAMPAAPGSLGVESPITTVAQGCGPGFHRNPWGRCRPNFGPRPFYGPRPYYARRCFVRPTPYGPRRFCR